METHKTPVPEKSRRNITEIIVHCTATPAGRNVGVKEIDRWHRQRGFNSIGYHYLVELDGTIATGRTVHLAGAHCKGHNSHSIGIAYAGGLDQNGQSADTRTPAQKTALRQMLAALRRLYPQARIHSHRDFAAKDCPCFNATSEYSDI
ncbi:MAG: N-acetylmuramoyl-L-alanine amidase [Muribaculaceae bacterium]|nr:N-acetylmuramoyl-L-alanine amidase [Muribaculaceae bacterium]